MHEQSPCDPRRFVSLCHRDEPCGPAFEQALEPASLGCGFASRMPDHRGRTQHEQSAQVAITLFGDPTLARFAAAAVLSGHQPDPGRKVPSGLELKRVGNRGDDRRCRDRPDTGISGRMTSLSLCHLTIVPSISFTRLSSAASSAANPRSASRASAGTFIASSPNSDQVRHACDALRRDDAQLRQMATKGVHQHRPLPYQQVARWMQHQYGLLFSGLDRHKAHRRSGHGRADRRGVGRVGFAALDISCHVSGRHQSHLMP
jgi:hypothetical protein